MSLIKLLSFNCYGLPISTDKRRRFKLLVNEIIKLNPDIVCLQEVYFKSQFLFFNKYLQETYPYHFYSQGKLFIDSTLVIFSKIPYLSAKFTAFKVQGCKNTMSIFDRLIFKGYHQLSFQFANQSFQLINAYLMANFYNRPGELQSNQIQLKELLQYVKQKRINRYILTGDLNFEKNSKAYQVATQKYHLLDLSQEIDISKNPNYFNRLAQIIMTPMIKKPDYIFSDHCQVKKCSIVFEKKIKQGKKSFFLSDHYGILAEIEI